MSRVVKFAPRQCFVCKKIWQVPEHVKDGVTPGTKYICPICNKQTK